MYIKKLVIENIRSFPGSHQFEFRPGVNYIVGDNNCGKSTLFEAILYLTGKLRNLEHFESVQANSRVRVEAIIAGNDLADLLADDKFQKYRPYSATDADGEPFVRVERSNQERTVNQLSKDVHLDGKKVCFWNPQTEQFENPTGIDALFKALIECEPIWADANPSEYADLSSTKTLGRLIDDVASRFFETPQWEKFSLAHEEAFREDTDESLGALTVGLAAEIQEIVNQQYGSAKVKFDFDLPAPSSFVKSGQLLVDDGAGETPLGTKGTGMQRAFALAVIQLYAKSLLATEGVSRPLILLLDEPETWLHPQAQLRLAEALSTIAGDHQLFLITHSPYLLRKFNSDSHQLVVFEGRGDERKIHYAQFMGLIGAGRPTWGEINYVAFGIPSYEFHNELYGEIQRRKELNSSTRIEEKDMDNWFETRGIPKDKEWKRSATHKYPATLPVYVRNSIHHPENTLNADFTDQELSASIEYLKTTLSQTNS